MGRHRSVSERATSKAEQWTGPRSTGDTVGTSAQWGARAPGAGRLVVGTVLACLAVCSIDGASAQQRRQSDGWSAEVAPAAPSAESSRPKRDAKPSERTPNTAVNPPVASAPAAAPRDDLYLAGDASRTKLGLDLTAETTPAVFRLSNPWRVVIDLPATELVRPIAPGQRSSGLVAGVRAGLIAPGKLRVVIDTTGPVAVELAHIHPGAAGRPSRLELALVPATSSSIRAAEIAGAAAALTLDVRKEEVLPARPQPKPRPVIVIDPGHGGIDPGAQGEKAVEKDIVLAVAREVRRALLATRRYEVVMTRQTDVFVALDQRVRISRQHNADLFLSLHADALEQKAQVVRGATVYTLADKATDARAALVAAKENASDLLAGLDVGQGQNEDSVRDILVDLMRRESANFSADFRKLLVGAMRPRVTVAREPFRSAPFKVLRQPGSPAVLVELGFISNASDEQVMLTQTWQRSVAEAVTQAVDAYFKKRSADETGN